MLQLPIARVRALVGARTLLLALCAWLLAGCGGLPQTAEAFRAMPGGFPAGPFRGTAETVEVDRPFAEVAAALREKAPQCLDRTVTVTTTIITRFREITKVYVTTFKPTVVATESRAELHLQARTKGELHVSRVPEGGPYRMVVDAYPLGSRTRLQWFGLQGDREVLFGAIRDWASGERGACPDLAKVRVAAYQ